MAATSGWASGSLDHAFSDFAGDLTEEEQLRIAMELSTADEYAMALAASAKAAAASSSASVASAAAAALQSTQQDEEDEEKSHTMSVSRRADEEEEDGDTPPQPAEAMLEDEGWGDDDIDTGMPDGAPALEVQWSQDASEAPTGSKELVRANSLPRPTVESKERQQRAAFRTDLNGLRSVNHQDDLENYTTTLFFQVTHVAEEFLYAAGVRPDATIEITIDASTGYRLPDAQLPKVTIEDAGGIKSALGIAIDNWAKVMWRLPDFDNVTGERFNYLEALAAFVLDRLATITLYCPLCGARHSGGGMLKLLPCRAKICTYKALELSLGSDPEFEVLHNPAGVDLLISMTYAAATSQRKQDVFVPFPESFVTCHDRNNVPSSVAAMQSRNANTGYSGAIGQNTNGSPLDSILRVELESSRNVTAVRDYALVVDILNKMPSVAWMRERLLHPELAAAELQSRAEAAAASGATPLHHGSGPITLRRLLRDFHPQAYYLLNWILATNRSYLRQVDLDEMRRKVAPLKIPDNVRQAFAFVNLPPEKEAAFKRKAAQARRDLVFHGAGNEVFHSIVRNSLRVLSNTRLMTAGAAYGAGVYFGKQFEVSAGYSQRQSAAAWPKSAEFSLPASGKKASSSSGMYQIGGGTGGLLTMLICEIVLNDKCKDHSSFYVHQDEEAITTRYLLRF